MTGASCGAGTDMVVMGRIAGAFGVKGWVKVQPFTGSVDSLLGYPVWWLGRAGAWSERKLCEGTAHGRVLIAHLAGCEDRESAAVLKGAEVAVPREQLPRSAQGEYYWADLIGLEVANREGVPLGRVVRLIETGANQVLVLGGDRERLIPFIEPVVMAVDLASGRLTVDWEADF
jgi:16S rRNA processing protein RimM